MMYYSKQCIATYVVEPHSKTTVSLTNDSNVRWLLSLHMWPTLRVTESLVASLSNKSAHKIIQMLLTSCFFFSLASSSSWALGPGATLAGAPRDAKEPIIVCLQFCELYKNNAVNLSPETSLLSEVGCRAIWVNSNHLESARGIRSACFVHPSWRH